MNAEKAYILGIDVGGTHVDIVAVNNKEQIIAFHKEQVSEHLEKNILDAINRVMSSGLRAEDCNRIHVGTTLAINSLLELKSLYRVGVIRIAGHHPELPPAFNWPTEKKRAIVAGFETISGGKEYDNKPIGTFNASDVIFALDKLIHAGAESIAITGVFSPLYSDEEDHVAQIISDSMYNNIPITRSHTVGGLGFVERENNTIINASLKKVIRQHFNYIEDELKKMGFDCDVLITQNNGTLLSLQQAMDFPIRTISSGPTNSLNGACKLAKLDHAIVIDIGGTSTEIGVVENGFPRYSSSGAMIAGIPTHFMLPAIEVLALGGGSIIHHQHDCFIVSSESLGDRLFSESLSCHGDVLTLFDVGNVIQNHIPENGVMPTLKLEQAELIMTQMMAQLDDGIQNILMDRETKVLFVGGGSQNIPQHFLQETMLRPAFYQVANAYGAALAEVCGTVDAIHELAKNRQDIIDELALRAIHQAIANGAEPGSVRIIEKRLLPFYYMSNQLTRIIITAAGRMV